VERTHLPVNVDPLKYDLKDDEERRRLAILLERGLNASDRVCAADSLERNAGWWALDAADRGYCVVSICI
jgi:hypothetical protein